MSVQTRDDFYRFPSVLRTWCFLLTGNEDQTLLRFLTPILKLYTGKKSVEVASETIEAIGGQGILSLVFIIRSSCILVVLRFLFLPIYLLHFFLSHVNAFGFQNFKAFIEDTHIPVLLRDAQVLSIWEGICVHVRSIFS